MPARYRAASILCCTSHYEGFPNTFIEAWSHGIPVVSTVDPDGLLATRRLGAAAGNAAEMVRAISSLLDDSRRWSESSRRAREYYLASHAVDSAMSRFEELFRRIDEDRP
jgi:glycosyltransferase involved in cell wall biosynthesis